MQCLLETKDYSLFKIKSQIYHLKFKDQYLLGMTLCRYQEFYESPNPDFNGKCFDLYDFMEWWVKSYQVKTFDYPVVWGGYNLTSDALAACLKLSTENKFYRFNKYDIVVKNIYDRIFTDLTPAQHIKDFYNPAIKFVLLGTCEATNDVLDHELAHAFFFLNPQYKQQALNLLKNELSLEQRLQFGKLLAEHGYADNVFEDEMQAYLATGLLEGYEKYITITKKTEKKFINFFQSFLKENQ